MYKLTTGFFVLNIFFVSLAQGNSTPFKPAESCASISGSKSEEVPVQKISVESPRKWSSLKSQIADIIKKVNKKFDGLLVPDKIHVVLDEGAGRFTRSYPGINEIDLYILGESKSLSLSDIANLVHEYGHFIFNLKIKGMTENARSLSGAYQEVFADVLAVCFLGDPRANLDFDAPSATLGRNFAEVILPENWHNNEIHDIFWPTRGFLWSHILSKPQNIDKYPVIVPLILETLVDQITSEIGVLEPDAFGSRLVGSSPAEINNRLITSLGLKLAQFSENH